MSLFHYKGPCIIVKSFQMTGNSTVDYFHLAIRYYRFILSIKCRNPDGFDGVLSNLDVMLMTNGSSVRLPNYQQRPQCWKLMMTSSNGNILRVTGPLCGKFTGHRWIPLTSDAELWYFFDLCLNKRLSKQSLGWWFETSSRSLWRHCDVSDEHIV